MTQTNASLSSPVQNNTTAVYKFPRMLRVLINKIVCGGVVVIQPSIQVEFIPGN